MADFSNSEDLDKISKGQAKRKYLLLDQDLDELEFESKENPLNKGYTPMKMFKLSEVESVAIEKWGSMEKLTSEQEKRRHQKVTLDNRREEERRHLWDCDKLYGPLQHFMEDIELPMERTSPYFSDKNAESNTGANDDVEDFNSCDIILCYCDCLHSILPDYVARRLLKKYPEARRVDKETPYNDRRKMGHFSWAVSPSKQQVIVNLYAVHKWKAAARGEVLNFDALGIALKRFSTLLTRTLEKNPSQRNSLKIGTYTPYGAVPETFKGTLQKNLDYPVRIFTNVLRDSSSNKSSEKRRGNTKDKQGAQE